MFSCRKKFENTHVEEKTKGLLLYDTYINSLKGKQ